MVPGATVGRDGWHGRRTRHGWSWGRSPFGPASRDYLHCGLGGLKPRREGWAVRPSAYMLGFLYLGSTDASGGSQTFWNCIKIMGHILLGWGFIAIIWFWKGLVSPKWWETSDIPYFIWSKLHHYFICQYIILPLKKDVYQKQKYFQFTPLHCLNFLCDTWSNHRRLSETLTTLKFLWWILLLADVLFEA